MTQWYYAHEGKQAGPVDEVIFRQWINEGRIAMDQLVWREGMAQWQEAGTIQGLFDINLSPPTGCDPQRALTEFPLDGTGGRTEATSIFSLGWRSMGQNFSLLLGAVILVTMFSLVPTILQYLFVLDLRTPSIEKLMFDLFNLLWTLFITFPLVLGISAFSLRVVCRQPAKIGDVFLGYRLLGKAIGLQLWMGLLIILWTLLLIIPGIIAALRYSQAIYLICYRPGLGINEAVKVSSDMMKGHKIRLFVLGLLLFLIGIAIYILVTIAVGSYTGFPNMSSFRDPKSPFMLGMQIVLPIAFIPVSMLQWMAFAHFHRDLTLPLSVGASTRE